jgi:hypothetical protein
MQEPALVCPDIYDFMAGRQLFPLGRQLQDRVGALALVAVSRAASFAQRPSLKDDRW